MTKTLERPLQLTNPSLWVPLNLGKTAVLHRVVPKQLVEKNQRLVVQQVLYDRAAGFSPLKGDDLYLLRRENPFCATITDTPGLYTRDMQREDGSILQRSENRTTFTIADCAPYGEVRSDHGSRIGEINEAIVPAGRFSFHYSEAGVVGSRLAVSEYVFLEPIIPGQRA